MVNRTRRGGQPSLRMCSEPYLFTFVDPVISPGFRLPYGGALTSGALNQPDREQCRAAAPPGEQANAPMSTELSRVAELADRLAERTLVAFEQGTLSTEEFRASPDLALVLDAARLLHAAGAEFPAGVGGLRRKRRSRRSFSGSKEKGGRS